MIAKDFHDWFIIAIDASLGDKEDVGTVNIHMGAIEPGAGVGKDLGQIGDISITGVVASDCLANCLNSIRLSEVMRLADFIYEGINKLNREKRRIRLLSEEIA